MRFAFLTAAFLMSAASAAHAVMAPAPDRPWLADNKTINAAVKDVHQAGIPAVGPHVADLEKALAGAKHSLEIAAAGDAKNVYVLVPDPGTTVPAPLQAEAKAAKKRLIVEPNPYLE